MKKNYIFTTITLVASGFILLSNSSGPGGDLTNAPGSTGSCANCHSGGTFTGSANIIVAKKGSTTPVTEYEAGVTYSVAVAITGGTSVSRGMQSTVLNASNAATGTIANVQGGATLISANSRNIVQHNAGSTLGAWTYEWTAPASPTGNVTVYLRGVIGNSAGQSSGDNVIETTKVLTLATTSNTVTNAPVQVKLYPNPAVNEVSFSKELKSIQIFNIQGQKVLSLDAATSINVSSLSVGTYFVKAQFNNEPVVLKFNKN